MTTKTLAVLGGTTVGLAAATYGLWRRRNDLREHFLKWKKEQIRNAYYDTLTQEDIAWG